MKIGKNTVAVLSYTLRYDNAQGDVVEEVSETQPAEMEMGRALMLEVLEKNLEGLAPGDGFEMVITPEQGYGEYDEEKIITIPESELMFDVPEEERTEIEEGDIIPVQDADGDELDALVLKKEGDKITLDFNHPYAGETLHFKGKVLDVRAAKK